MNPERYEALQRIGCIACRKHGPPQPNRTEAHHIVDKGYREHSGGDAATIGLCQWHHRGIQLEGFSAGVMKAYWGPSFHNEKKLFIETFGGERELLSETDALILAQ